MKVAIVVGHEQNAQGAVNKTHGVTEFQFNSELASLIQEALDHEGIDNVVVFRENGYSQLPYDINRTSADIALELHANAANTVAKGCETLYWHTSKNGKRLASCIQDSILGIYKPLADRKIKPKNQGDRGATVLRKTSMPCVILEPFFIDNNQDYKYAKKNIEVLAFSIVDGIKQYKAGL